MNHTPHSPFRRILTGLALTVTFIGALGGSPRGAVAQQGTGTIRVDDTAGNDAPDCGSEAAPCRTIQHAISESNTGDTILVATGTYIYDSQEDTCYSPLGVRAVVCVVNQELTISGGYSASDWSTADPGQHLTIIDGQDAYRGVFVAGTGPTTYLRMEGFTIQNGLARGIPARPGDDQIFAFGGGMFVDMGSAPGPRDGVTLRRMVFKDNQSIGENTTSSYGGSGTGGGLAMRMAEDSVLEHIVFQENEARGGTGNDRGGYALGGAFNTDRSVVAGRYLTFTNNLAVAGNSTGGGIDYRGERADALGGAVAIMAGSIVVLQNVKATANTAQGGNSANNSGGAFGGAIKVQEAALTLISSDLRNNLAQGGTGVNGWLGNGGGLEAIDSDVTIDRSWIVNNIARGGNGTSGDKGAAGGGGINSTWILDQYDASLQVTNSVIADNLAEMGAGTRITGGGGGGIWIQATQATIAHTTVARNQVGSSMQGQAILLIEVRDGNNAVRRAATVTMADSIIAEHTGFTIWQMAAIHVKPSNTLTLNRGLLAGNTKDTNADSTVGPAGTFNGLSSMTTTSSAAGFIASGSPNYDYHITKLSPAKDQATNCVFSIDIDDEARGLFGPHDFGADEYTPIVLTVMPVASGAMRLSWKTNLTLVPRVNHYDIVITCAAGAQPPVGASCDTPIEAGAQINSLLFSGMTISKLYTFTVKAQTANESTIESSNRVMAVPIGEFLYLPFVSS